MVLAKKMDAPLSDIKGIIHRYVFKQYRVEDEDAFGDTVNLFEEGIIDSLGAFDVAAFLESTFKVRFTEEHFFDKRFRSIEGMASLIAEIKQAEGTHGASSAG